MAKKKYTIKTACPQCGCSGVSVLTEEEMKERYGHVPNVELECGECMLKYQTEMQTACPEWDKECKPQP
jgi:transcription elongation factor Elf1